MLLFGNHERDSGKGGGLNQCVLSFCLVNEWAGCVERKEGGGERNWEAAKGMRQGKK